MVIELEFGMQVVSMGTFVYQKWIGLVERFVSHLIVCYHYFVEIELGFIHVILDLYLKIKSSQHSTACVKIACHLIDQLIWNRLKTIPLLFTCLTPMQGFLHNTVVLHLLVLKRLKLSLFDCLVS